MSNSLLDKILDATNGGLDIILEYYPNATDKKNFKVRAERTSSASLKLLDNGVYVVTDFGEDSVSRNAIAVAAKESGKSFRDALIEWGAKLGLLDAEKVLRPDFKKPKITEIEYEFDENGYYFDFKLEMTEAELDHLGPLVSQEVCKRYKLFAVNFYARKDENSQVMEFHSTENYPIYVFANKTADKKDWYKILQPKSQDKKYRFFYVGGRPKDFVFGLDHVQKTFNSLQPVADEESDEEVKTQKIERVLIGSGDRDSLNLAGAGELVVWLNSETEGLNPFLYSKLQSMAEQIINVPDIDETGRNQGREMALEYLNIYTAWLPEFPANRRDFRNHAKKDFLDFCNDHRHNLHKLKNEVRLLLDNAKSCRFWDVSNTKAGMKYEFNNVNAYYFLGLCGFAKLTNPENSDDYIFIKKTGHVVEKVNYLAVKDFVNKFLEEKQRQLGDRYISDKLRNTIYNSTRMNEPSLANLNQIELDFTDYGPKYQLFFFENEVWQVSANSIVSNDSFGKELNVWKTDLLPNLIKDLYKQEIDERKFKIESPYFTIFKDKEGNWDIQIHRQDIEFLNYLINTSRVHWQKEHFALAMATDEEKETYWKENKFTLEGTGLTADEIHEQKLHLINKIYIYGYLLHRYKSPNKSWLVWLMDNEIVDDDESHGRTGKSIYSKSFQHFMNMKYIGSRNRRLFDNNHIYDGIDEHTDFLLFDDANKYFNIENIYTEITGDFNVNPKNNKPFSIPFSKSPKMSVSTNYAVRSNDGSTMDRLLIGAFGNWYHAASVEFDRRTPADDFGRMMFNQWPTEEWNRFFNFGCQALQFFLKTEEKINAPASNVMKRNSLTQMGKAFQNWADIYLPEYINQSENGETIFEKQAAYENMKQTERSISSSSMKDFTKKLHHWCIYNDVALDPPSKVNTKDGRIIHNIDGQAKQFHYLLQLELTEQTDIQVIEPDENEDELDKLKF